MHCHIKLMKTDKSFSKKYKKFRKENGNERKNDSKSAHCLAAKGHIRQTLLHVHLGKELCGRLVLVYKVVFKLNKKFNIKRGRLLSELALFESAANRQICQMRPASAVNRTRHVGSVTCARYR